VGRSVPLEDHRLSRRPTSGEMREMAFASSAVLAAKSQGFHVGRRCVLGNRIVSITAAKPPGRSFRVMAVASEEAVTKEEPDTKFTRILNIDVTNGGWIVDAEVVNFKKKSLCVAISLMDVSPISLCAIEVALRFEATRR
jgi:hypothetical protein